jgi:hypothetical protein
MDMAPELVVSHGSVDGEVVVRRSRRARRWILRAPWGEPALLAFRPAGA